MATEVKQAPAPAAPEKLSGDRVVASAQAFWSKNSKFILYGLAAVVLLVGGFFAYKFLYIGPQEEKAADAIWKAELNFKKDSFNLALNGSGTDQGFLKVIKTYGSTKNGNRAKFYAGACYVQLGDFNNAVKYLNDFAPDEKAVAVRAYGLLGDAYAELGKKDEAISAYKKAGKAFPEDDFNSAEYLTRAAFLLYDQNKQKEAIDLLVQVKKDYPQSIQGAQQGGQDVDKYLAKWGYTK